MTAAKSPRDLADADVQKTLNEFTAAIRSAAMETQDRAHASHTAIRYMLAAMRARFPQHYPALGDTARQHILVVVSGEGGFRNTDHLLHFVRDVKSDVDATIDRIQRLRAQLSDLRWTMDPPATLRQIAEALAHIRLRAEVIATCETSLRDVVDALANDAP